MERGCCWSPSLFSSAWCYYAKAKSEITDVHVVQGAHLDVGFLKTAPEIINLWFHSHFPRAYTIGSQLQKLGNQSTARLMFTAQSFLISLFFDCPKAYEALGVLCPNETEIAMVKTAIANDWLTWHAFPFNGEMETMDASLIEFGLAMTHQLDDAFGKPRKYVLSQRDVPGMTVNVIPILLKHGIKAISVGVNGGSTPPDVPQSFLWRNKRTNQSMRTFYVQGGYGGLGSVVPWDAFAWTGVPGSGQVMVIDWRGDNAGPPETVQDVLSDWEKLQLEFPSANIFASSFDRYVEAVANIPDTNLPLIDKEIGDTWIHGIMSDPVKVSKMQIANELRARCLKRGQCSLNDSRVWQFSRFLLKNGEHTWGLDNKVTLPEVKDCNWTNVDLDTIKDSKGGKAIIESWMRQRQMGIDIAIDALGNHSLKYSSCD